MATNTSVIAIELWRKAMQFLLRKIQRCFDEASLWTDGRTKITAIASLAACEWNTFPVLENTRFCFFFLFFLFFFCECAQDDKSVSLKTASLKRQNYKWGNSFSLISCDGEVGATDGSPEDLHLTENPTPTKTFCLKIPVDLRRPQQLPRAKNPDFNLHHKKISDTAVATLRASKVK